MTLLTKNGTDAVAENEAPETPEQPKAPEPTATINPMLKRMQEDKEFLLHLSLPTIWLEEHYTKYTNAESAALAKGVDQVMARYYGVLALFRAQDVRVVNLPKLQELLSKPDSELAVIPLAVKGAMIRAVANPLEAAINAPFLDFFTE